jgi:Kinetochore complex Sim4 subunit Fta1
MTTPAAAAAAAAHAALDLIPTVPLPEFLLHHTWSIHQVSSFAVPLLVTNALEREMTRALRNHWINTASNERGNSKNLGDHKGTLVRVLWGTPKKQEPTRKSGKNNQSSKKKRNAKETKSQGSRSARYGPSTNVETLRQTFDLPENVDDNNQQSSECHLFIEAIVNDEPSAQVVCCFPEFDDASIQKLAFLLTRGSKRSLEAIFQFLAHKAQCRVAKTVFRPSVVDMTLVMTWWTCDHWQLTNNATSNKDNQNQSSDNRRKRKRTESCVSVTKPLMLTYSVPASLASTESGLTSLSLMVPPGALLRLCTDIQASRPSQQEPPNDASSQRTETGGGIPLLIALQQFLRETFRVRIEKFSLTDASCSAAILGRDGRCKPLCPQLLESVLIDIKGMVDRSGDAAQSEQAGEQEEEDGSRLDPGLLDSIQHTQGMVERSEANATIQSREKGTDVGPTICS